MQGKFSISIYSFLPSNVPHHHDHIALSENLPFVIYRGTSVNPQQIVSKNYICNMSLQFLFVFYFLFNLCKTIPSISRKWTESWIMVRPRRQMVMLRWEQVCGGTASLHRWRSWLAVSRLWRAGPVQLAFSLLATGRQLRRPHVLYNPRVICQSWYKHVAHKS